MDNLRLLCLVVVRSALPGGNAAMSDSQSCPSRLAASRSPLLLFSRLLPVYVLRPAPVPQLAGVERARFVYTYKLLDHQTYLLLSRSRIYCCLNVSGRCWSSDKRSSADVPIVNLGSPPFTVKATLRDVAVLYKDVLSEHSEPSAVVDTWSTVTQRPLLPL